MSYKINEIKKTINSANINFLVGSGMSRPFLETLKNIEKDLTEAENKKNNEVEILKLKENYFNNCMVDNLKIIDDDDTSSDDVLKKYENFYKTMNHILLERNNSLLTKQINIFTTNIDIFSEKALEDSGIEFNDGFHGRFNPIYDVGNFKKSYFKKSLHYENTSEIPVFNILKLHGSLSWKENADNIYLDKDLFLVNKIKNGKVFKQEDYDKLQVVNPTKKKFEITTQNQRYYDLLRIYSNELEKENSVLFVLGFSFADEHIRDLTKRVADSNPTLKIFIFSHSNSKNDDYDKLESGAKNKNVEVLFPKEGENFNLETITVEIFNEIVPFEEELLTCLEEENEEG